ncbi:MAG TPA: outer membrane beta-barrel protein [Polyangia bacterium]|nr:outer membrane beta-barrel protein [Polyangia bacterium]
MRKNIAILSILATSLMSYAAMAQTPPEGAPPVIGDAPPAGAPPEIAPAPAPAPAPEAAPVAASESKFQVGVAFLPILLGKYKMSGGGMNESQDLKFAYGFGITAGYTVIPGLSVGLAPQLILGLKPDVAGAPSDSATELDIMARIAYAYHVIPALAIYAEVMPGYSIIMIPDSWKGGVSMDSAKGFVFAGGVGAAYDINEMFFVNLAVGYQIGFQSTSVMSTSVDMKTSALRIAVGGGVKF